MITEQIQATEDNTMAHGNISSTIKKVPITELYRNSENPREDTKAAILADKIEIAGQVLVPLIVLPVDESGKRKIIDGNRRHEALETLVNNGSKIDPHVQIVEITKEQASNQEELLKIIESLGTSAEQLTAFGNALNQYRLIMTRSKRLIDQSIKDSLHDKKVKVLDEAKAITKAIGQLTVELKTTNNVLNMAFNFYSGKYLSESVRNEILSNFKLNDPNRIDFFGANKIQTIANALNKRFNPETPYTPDQVYEMVKALLKERKLSGTEKNVADCQETIIEQITNQLAETKVAADREILAKDETIDSHVKEVAKEIDSKTLAKLGETSKKTGTPIADIIDSAIQEERSMLPEEKQNEPIVPSTETIDRAIKKVEAAQIKSNPIDEMDISAIKQGIEGFKGVFFDIPVDLFNEDHLRLLYTLMNKTNDAVNKLVDKVNKDNIKMAKEAAKATEQPETTEQPEEPLTAF